MHIRTIFAALTGIALLLTVSTQDLRAATAADSKPAKVHVLGEAELHQAVLDSSVETAKARKTVQDFLTRSEVQTQIKRMGFEPAAISSGVALLSDSELMRLQSQVMSADEQIRTAGFPAWGIVLIAVVVTIGVVAIVIAAMID